MDVQQLPDDVYIDVLSQMCLFCLFPSLENHTTISLQKYTTYQCKVNVFFSLLKERCFNAQESALSCALKAGARDRLNAFNMKYINRLTISLFLLHDKTFHSY